MKIPAKLKPAREAAVEQMKEHLPKAGLVEDKTREWSEEGTHYIHEKSGVRVALRSKHETDAYSQVVGFYLWLSAPGYLVKTYHQHENNEFNWAAVIAKVKERIAGKSAPAPTTAKKRGRPAKKVETKRRKAS